MTSETDTKINSTKAGKWPVWPAYVIGGCLRWWLLSCSWLLSDRVELATPLNSYKRLVEGLTLYQSGVDPYSGALFHETPLALFLFKAVRNYPPLIPMVFVLSDLLSAFILGRLATQVHRVLIRNQERDRKAYHQDAEDLLVTGNGFAKVTQMTYLFHPYLIANCGAKTTTTFTNLVILVFLWACVSKKRVLASATLALATYQTFYPVMLLFPLCLTLAMDDVSGDVNLKKLPVVIVSTLASFLAAFTALNWASYTLMGSWNFLYSTHGFVLSVPELTPNIGLFWYFFTEMFEHFRLFFVWTFQLNCFVYVLPLTIKLKKQPFLLAWTLLALTTIFKSYPCYGDVGLYLAILPILSYLFPYMKQMFFAANMFVAATVLGPIMYQMWIYNGSANSNYYFAINLVFGVAQILLVTDLLFAQIKREFYLLNGYKDLQTTSEDPNKTRKLTFK